MPMPVVSFEGYAALFLRYYPKRTTYSQEIYLELIEKYGVAKKCYHIYPQETVQLMKDDPDVRVVYGFGMPKGQTYIDYCYKKVI